MKKKKTGLTSIFRWFNYLVRAARSAARSWGGTAHTQLGGYGGTACFQRCQWSHLACPSTARWWQGCDRRPLHSCRSERGSDWIYRRLGESSVTESQDSSPGLVKYHREQLFTVLWLPASHQTDKSETEIRKVPILLCPHKARPEKGSRWR